MIEFLWAMKKSRIDISKVANQSQIFKVERIWNEIPNETINLLVNSFFVRLQAHLRYDDKSLNGK